MGNLIKSHHNVIESDVSLNERTQIVLDCHNIPFSDNSFDCIIAQAVLEHVKYPLTCVSEIHRVLKKGGIIYAETPFMQQVHGEAYDFYRFTLSGHRILFEKFIEIEAGAVSCAGTSLLWSIEYFFLEIFYFSKVLQNISKVSVRVLFFWLKYFDLLSIRNKAAFKYGANGYFFLGIKENTNIDIIAYFKKT